MPNPSPLSSIPLNADERGQMHRELSEQLQTSLADHAALERQEGASPSPEAATTLNHIAYDIAELEAALHRIDEGTYGRCESCRLPIPLTRLEVIPYARRCIGCTTGWSRR